MPIRIEEGPEAMTAYLSGDIDHQSARELMLGLDRAVVRRDPARLVVDMAGVTFMDSSGIAVLLRALRGQRERQGTMAVRNIPAQAGRVLRAAGIHKLIPLEP